MTVSTPPYSTPLGRAFIKAGIQMGYPNVDVNGPTMSGETPALGIEQCQAKLLFDFFPEFLKPIPDFHFTPLSVWF